MDNDEVKIAVYFEYFLSPRLGGPPGYLYNLNKSLNLNHDATGKVKFFTLDSVEDMRPELSVKTSIARWKILKKWKAEKKKRKIASRTANDHAGWLEALPHDGSYESDLLNSIFQDSWDIVHAHTTIDAAKLIRATKGMKNAPRVALTSHCPEPPAQEWSEKMRVDGADEISVSRYRKAYEKVDLYAFENADILVFPCEEAMEPYLNSIKEFGEIIRNKDVRFAPTGAPQLQAKLNSYEKRLELGIPPHAFVIGYIGRHNKVKGYDILKSEGLNLLKSEKNAWIVCAGAEGPISAPRHQRWLEAGWETDPGSLINAFDVFVLPNRETYFDLISLEVLSVGTPLIASATGGNKFIGAHSDGVLLYAQPEDLGKTLKSVMDSQSSTRDKMRRANLEAYSQYFSMRAFGENYLKAMQNA